MSILQGGGDDGVTNSRGCGNQFDDKAEQNATV